MVQICAIWCILAVFWEVIQRQEIYIMYNQSDLKTSCLWIFVVIFFFWRRGGTGCTWQRKTQCITQKNKQNMLLTKYAWSQTITHTWDKSTSRQGLKIFSQLSKVKISSTAKSWKSTETEQRRVFCCFFLGGAGARAPPAPPPLDLALCYNSNNYLQLD